jgi:hypothetical protein
VSGYPSLHVVKHDGVCGERISSPHTACQAKAAPYPAAELVTVTRAGIGPVRVVLYRCHGCNATWQGNEATA